MKTKFLATVTALLLAASSCIVKNSKNDATDGKDTTVNTNSTTTNLKKPKKSILIKPSFKLVEQFNEMSMPCDETKQTYMYDDKGRVIEYSCYSFDDQLLKKDSFKYNLKIKGVLKYDTSGNRIEEDYYNEDGSLNCKNIYKYDVKGNMIEQERDKSDGSLDNKSTYKYDNNGDYFEKTTYDINSIKSSWSVSYKHTFKYDVKGNLIEKNEIDLDDGDNSGGMKDIYKYDDKSNLIERNFYGSVFLLRYIYKYNVKGCLIELNRYDERGGEHLSYKTIYKNDDIGNCIERDEYDADGKSKGSSDFKYDTYGNMIEQRGGLSLNQNPMFDYYKYLLPGI